MIKSCKNCNHWIKELKTCVFVSCKRHRLRINKSYLDKEFKLKDYWEGKKMSKRNIIVCDSCGIDISNCYYEKIDRQLCGSCFVDMAKKKLKWEELCN